MQQPSRWEKRVRVNVVSVIGFERVNEWSKDREKNEPGREKCDTDRLQSLQTAVASLLFLTSLDFPVFFKTFSWVQHTLILTQHNMTTVRFRDRQQERLLSQHNIIAFTLMKRSKNPRHTRRSPEPSLLKSPLLLSSSFSCKSIYTDFYFLSVLLEFLNCFTQLSCWRKIIDNHQLIYSLLWLFVPGLVLTEEWQTPLTWGYTRSIFFVTIFCLRHLPLFKSLLFLLPNFSTNHPNFYCLVIPGESYFNLCLSLQLQKREERLTKSLVAFFKKDCHLVTFIFFVNTFFFSWLIVKRHHGPEGKD